MIQALLLDYDGVVTRGIPDGTVAQRLANNLKISYKTASEWIGTIWKPLLKGTITEDEVWRIFEQKYGGAISFDQRDIWFKWAELQPLPEMIALIQELRAKGYPVGVVSNVTPITSDEIRKNGGYDNFDFAVLSAEVGYKKPEPEIFAYCLQRLGGMQPNNVLFLDDREHNTTAAKQLGMQTIFVTNPEQAIRDIKLLLDT